MNLEEKIPPLLNQQPEKWERKIDLDEGLYKTFKWFLNR
jgi:hypothetical protein